MDNWRLINYNDVWGNEEDGFEVNNLYVAKEGILLESDATEQDIADLLLIIEFLTTNDLEEVHIDNMGDMIEISQRSNMYPLGRLEKVY